MQEGPSRIALFCAKAFNLVVIAVALTMYGVWAQKASAHDTKVLEQIEEAKRKASRGPYATDGTFVGTAQGYNGSISMRVVVQDGYIASVEVVDAGSEDAAFLGMCKDLPARVVKGQTTSIDTVSGATFTSSGILDATADALRQSMGGDAK